MFGCRHRRTCGGQRLGFEDVERGAGETAGFHGGQQVVFAKNRAARDVDDECAAREAEKRDAPRSPVVAGVNGSAQTRIVLPGQERRETIATGKRLDASRSAATYASRHEPEIRGASILRAMGAPIEP
jgi:hypothetical protein